MPGLASGELSISFVRDYVVLIVPALIRSTFAITNLHKSLRKGNRPYRNKVVKAKIRDYDQS